MYDTETKTGTGTGWPARWGAVIGGVGGYLVGRNSNGCNSNLCGHPAAVAVGAGELAGGCYGRQTCFQEGEYAGENRAGINFIAQTVNRNQDEIQAVNANVNAQFASLKDQKIQDLMAEKQALQTQMMINNGNCAINNQLALINQTLNSITTGCGVKSYPSCCGGCGCNA